MGANEIKGNSKVCAFKIEVINHPITHVHMYVRCENSQTHIAQSHNGIRGDYFFPTTRTFVVLGKNYMNGISQIIIIDNHSSPSLIVFCELRISECALV